MNVAQLTIAEIQNGLRNKAFSALELAQAANRFAAQENPKTNAYLTLSPEAAEAAARAVDEKLARGEDPGPMAAVPVGVKDVISTEGIRTTCASRLLENYVPPYNATAVDRLLQQGALIIGKANCDEFAMGSSNENSAFGPVQNPVAPGYVPGGSSGGSAAVVAQGTAVVSLGSDTGGSIRQPASFCGVVGITPTYGRVSRYGLVAFASSLDHIGPFAKNVEDSAILLEAIAGKDPLDATSALAPVPHYVEEMKQPVKGLRLGLPKEFLEGLPPETASAIDAAAKTLEALGCSLHEVSLPHTQYAVDCYYILATAEASSNLARYDGVRYTSRAEASSLTGMYRKTRGQFFGPECKRRIMLGTYVLSHGYYDAFYKKAQQVRALITQDLKQNFASVDALLAPVSPTPAFKLGEKISNPLEMYLADIYTLTGSLSGVPCMSVPCGASPAGLPIGLQILTPHFTESLMLRIAYNYEQARINS